MNKPKRGISRFGIFLAVYAAIALLMVVIALVMVWFYADAYELSQPKNAVEEYINGLNTDLWNDDVAAAISSMPHELQTDDECKEAVRALLSGGITYSSSIGSGNQDEFVYSLRCGNGTIGKITVAPDYEKGKLVFGMYEYRVVDEEYDFSGLYAPVQITVPSSFTVKLNGIVLGGKYVADTIEYDVLKPYYGVFSDLPVKYTYRYDRAVGSPEFEVFDNEGNSFTVTGGTDEEELLQLKDEAKIERIEGFINKFNDRYRTFISGVSEDPYSSYQRLAPYLKTGTELQKRLESAIDGLTWGHTYSISVDSCDISSILSFGGGIYMCRFTTDFTTQSPAGTMQDTEEDMILIQETDGDIRVFAMDSK